MGRLPLLSIHKTGNKRSPEGLVFFGYSKLIIMNNYRSFNQEEIKSALKEIGADKCLENSMENLKLVFSMIDLTSLSADDTREKIVDLCLKTTGFSDHFSGIQNVAAICTFPSLIPVVKEFLTTDGVSIASVSAGFPSSQTFLPVKEMESKMAVDAGATEIDIVISVGKYLENDLEFVSEEIEKIKKAVAPAKLKVILETGLLPSPDDIYKASITSLKAGADFIKTSTGKVQPAATPEAVYVMCHAIRDFHDDTSKVAGIKPAGGISTPDQALMYASIIKTILGEEWLDPNRFRIGASRLANNILSEISCIKSGKTARVSYF
jgi:deoxyribose-phosphate aldolase